MNSIKRVLLIHTDGNTFNNPTLKCVVDLLLEHQVNVTIRYPQNFALMPKMQGVLLLPFGKVYAKLKNVIFNKLCWGCISWLSVWFENTFIYDNYDLIIGVDRQGLIEAGFLNRMTSTPFVYFSFEIMFESETSARYKFSERQAAKYAKQWFVQDELRATHLQKENGLNPAKKTIVPLASSGSAETSTNRLRDRLGVSPEKKVAIAMGSISNWSMAYEIISSVTNWPDDWVLVVHDRYGRTEIELERLGYDVGEIFSEKIYLSNQSTILVDDMAEILAGVSAGLAFYRPDYCCPYTGKNLEYLGLASGKISTFLRYGIPVIMNEIGSYSDLAKEFGFGLVAEEAADIAHLLPLFIDSSWSNNANRYYKVYLDFENYKHLVWGKLLDVKKTY
ncbi:family 2 glycosyl transferase [Methylomonas methanica]|uniref:Glycosyl transferase family 2 n=1 Tax=Methylomonas methanica (strain DSM 25384 / MC09) TaxID=857087 RepID=F9ZWE7_METMM|nr:family 2 glycosyl transferase [Methylomonas methanica]AEF99616.1 glycosyl transferase family 2 [Methylomonas methanica MC09]